MHKFIKKNEHIELIVPGVQKMPVQWEKAPPWIREKYLLRYPEYMNYTFGPDTLKGKKINIHRALDFILRMNKDLCKNYTSDQLELGGDTDYGAEEFFENEAKMALRLANFISAFLQVRIKKNSARITLYRFCLGFRS